MPRRKERKRRGRNEGGLYQREDGLWVGSIGVGFHPQTGNRLRKVVYGKTKEEAQGKLDDLRQKYRAGELTGEEMKTRTFLDFWIDSAVKRKTDPATYALHRQRIDAYLVPQLGHVPVAAITPFMVLNLYEEMEKAGHSRDLQNKVGQLLRRALKVAVRNGWAKSNAAAEVELPRVTKEEMHPLDAAQVRRFLAVARKHRLYALWLLALDTGMRQGEIIALEWADVDLEAGVVSVTKSAKTGEKGGGVRVKEVKTRSSRRRIRLARRTVAALREWRRQARGKLVFPAQRHRRQAGGEKHLLKCCLQRGLHRLLARAGLPRIRFHDLRHTHATLALLATRNIKAVSARLGHGDIRVTLNTYSHYLPVMEEEYAAKMEELLVPEADAGQCGPVATVRLQKGEEEAKESA